MIPGWKRQVLVGFDANGQELWADAPTVLDDRTVHHKPGPKKADPPAVTHPTGLVRGSERDGWLCASCGAVSHDWRLFEENGCAVR